MPLDHFTSKPTYFFGIDHDGITYAGSATKMIDESDNQEYLNVYLKDTFGRFGIYYFPKIREVTIGIKNPNNDPSENECIKEQKLHVGFRTHIGYYNKLGTNKFYLFKELTHLTFIEKDKDVIKLQFILISTFKSK